MYLSFLGNHNLICVLNFLTANYLLFYFQKTVGIPIGICVLYQVNLFLYLCENILQHYLM